MIFLKLEKLLKNLINYLKEFLLEINFYKLSVFKSATVPLLSTGVEDFLIINTVTTTAARTATQAITIPAIAPPDNPLELFG